MNMRESIVRILEYSRKYFCPLWRAIETRGLSAEGANACECEGYTGL